MPKKTTAVDELSALKARHDGSATAPTVVDLASPTKGGGVLGRSALIGLAVILAVGSGTALTLAYRQLRDLAARESAVRIKEERIAELDDRIAQAGSQVASSQAQLEQLKGEIKATEKYAAKGSAAAAAYRIYSTMVPSMKAESETLTTQINQRKEERTRQAGDIAREQAALASLLATQSNMVSRIERLQVDVDGYEAQSQSLRESIASNRVAAASQDQLVRHLAAERAELESSVGLLLADLDRYSAQHDEIKNALPGLRQVTASLRAERAAATNELASLHPELTRLSGRVHEERRELARLDAQKTKLEEAILGINAQKAERDALAKKKAQLTADLSALTQLVEQQQSQVADSEGRVAVAKKNIRELEEQRLELERAVSQLIGERRALESQKAEQE